MGCPFFRLLYSFRFTCRLNYFTLSDIFFFNCYGFLLLNALVFYLVLIVGRSAKEREEVLSNFTNKYIIQILNYFNSQRTDEEAEVVWESALGLMWFSVWFLYRCFSCTLWSLPLAQVKPVLEMRTSREWFLTLHEWMLGLMITYNNFVQNSRNKG